MTDLTVHLHAWPTRFYLGLVFSQVICVTAGSIDGQELLRVFAEFTSVLCGFWLCLGFVGACSVFFLSLFGCNLAGNSLFTRLR